MAVFRKHMIGQTAWELWPYGKILWFSLVADAFIALTLLFSVAFSGQHLLHRRLSHWGRIRTSRRVVGLFVGGAALALLLLSSAQGLICSLAVLLAIGSCCYTSITLAHFVSIHAAD